MIRILGSYLGSNKHIVEYYRDLTEYSVEQYLGTVLLYQAVPEKYINQ